MGAGCCKNLDSPVSPKLPLCEVLRRCARQMCPMGPSVQKPISRNRDFGQSDIVVSVGKRDSCSQTDPLPPPRRKKKNKYRRKRSMSVDFLPYLLKDAMMTSGSLGDLSGHEDAIDFTMFFATRLPENSLTTNEEGKDCISGKKKVFLSGLLGEENNNLPAVDDIQSPLPKHHALSIAGQEIVPSSLTETNSRKSSITESLKEFESSLLDMLQDIGEEEEDHKSVISNQLGNQRFSPSQLKTKELEMSPLSGVKEDEYILTPLEEEDDESIWKVNKLTINKKICHDQIDTSKVVTMNAILANRDGDKENDIEEKNNDSNNLKGQCVDEDKRVDKLTTIETPTITVQTVS